MSQCLLTTLPDACTDTTIRKLGELRVSSVYRSGETKNSRSIGVVAAQPIVVTANGSGFFTARAGTASVGTSVEIPASSDLTNITYFYPGNANFTFSFANKYAVRRLIFGEEALGWVINNLAFDLSEVRYMTSLERFHDQVSQVTSGDIANFCDSSNLTELWIDESLGRTFGDLSVCGRLPLATLHLVLAAGKLTGNITVLSGRLNLTVLSLENGSAVTGNLSSLSSLTKLTTINLNGTQVAGNFSSLYNCTNLSILKIANTSITGDLAALRQRCAKLTTVDVTGTSVTGS